MVHKIKILFVYDRPNNSFPLETTLRDIEADFIKVDNSIDALKAVLHYDFALAILDVAMSEKDAYELVR
ncbi:MAG: hybrid sensor histidine kinase/response regulator, partial [Candidatus Electrothrix sp. ATG2]|nr:hybrid sensor histidine kinase/response regulator [Candidatus Electrothrix sp. ATG2]